MDVEEALKLAEEIMSLINEEISEDAWAKASDFFSGVLDRTSGIAASIEEREKVSGKQLQALENMKAGVEKWLKR